MDILNEFRELQIKQDFAKNNFSEKINNLPYLFKDPHKLDKKIDIKKLQFGSKIDGGRAVKRENFYTVKEIINPEKSELAQKLKISKKGIYSIAFGTWISFYYLIFSLELKLFYIYSPILDIFLHSQFCGII